MFITASPQTDNVNNVLCFSVKTAVMSLGDINFQLYYNLKRPTSDMWPDVDQDVGMWYITLFRIMLFSFLFGLFLFCLELCYLVSEYEDFPDNHCFDI